MKQWKNWLAAVTLVSAVGAGADAAVMLSFEAGPATPGSGGSLELPIYLREVLTDGSSSAIAPEGLYSFGLSVNRTSGDAVITDLVRHSTFDRRNGGSTTSFPATAALLSAEQDANFGNGPTPDVSGRVLLATVTVLPGGSLSTFGLGDFNAVSDETINYRFQALDSQISPGSFAVPAVPEPAALGLVVLALPLLGRRRR